MQLRSIGTMLLLTAVLSASLAACGKTPDADISPAEKSAAGEETETETETETDIRATLSDELPEVTFQDRDFPMLTRSRDDFRTDMGLELEGTTGDCVNDALYLRNLHVEERFQVKLSAQYEDVPVSTANRLMQSGDDAFFLMLDNAENTGMTVTSGNYRNWKDLPYIQPDKPWYINNAMEAMSVAGNSYMLAGEYNISVLRFTYCTYFNKELAEDKNIPDLYSLVKDGKWTYDVLYDLVQDVHDDLNGDGVMDDADVYGLATDYYEASTNYMYSMDKQVASPDADGVPQFTYMDDKMSSIFDRVYTLLYENAGVYSGDWNAPYRVWKAGHALFANAFFQDAATYRELPFDFGVLPYPKYDENQQRYYTHANIAYTVCAIPTTVQDIDFACIITEGLQSESWRTVVPAYYENALKVKYARDNIAASVIDLILEGRTFDFGLIYDQNKGYAKLMQQCLSTKKANFTSRYQSLQKKANAHYQEIIDAYLAMTDASER